MKLFGNLFRVTHSRSQEEDLIKKKYEIVSRYNIWNFNFNSDNTYQIEQFDNQKAKEFVMTGKYELKDDTILLHAENIAWFNISNDNETDSINANGDINFTFDLSESYNISDFSKQKTDAKKIVVKTDKSSNILIKNEFQIIAQDSTVKIVFNNNGTYNITKTGKTEATNFYIEGIFEQINNYVFLHPTVFLNAPNGTPIKTISNWGEGLCMVSKNPIEMEVGSWWPNKYTKQLRFDSESDIQYFGISSYIEKKVDELAEPIDLQILTQNEFLHLCYAEPWTSKIKFKKDMTYSITLDPWMDGNKLIEGNYEIKDNIIYLHPKKIMELPSRKIIKDAIGFDEAQCYIKNSSISMEDEQLASVYFSKTLVLREKSEIIGSYQFYGLSGFIREATKEEMKNENYKPSKLKKYLLYK